MDKSNLCTAKEIEGRDRRGEKQVAEMAQWLSVYSALTEDSNLVPKPKLLSSQLPGPPHW